MNLELLCPQLLAENFASSSAFAIRPSGRGRHKLELQSPEDAIRSQWGSVAAEPGADGSR
jgi:hypothetical protein